MDPTRYNALATVGLRNLENALAHYGVKGMRWGVRKGDSTSARLGFKKPDPSEDKQRVNESASKVKRGNTDALSNKELQALVTRMNLEQQYSRLATQSRTKSSGQKFVSDIMNSVAKQQLTKIANDQATKQVEKIMNAK